MNIPAPLDPVAELKNRYPDEVLHVKTFRNETTIIVNGANIVAVMMFLRNTAGLVYNYLSDISTVDYYPADYGEGFDGTSNDFRPERFAVSYHLYSMLYNRRLRVKVFANEENPAVPSITTVWPAANWLEREAMDLMGITFENHPDPRRLLLPEDWDGHPHRRDVPMGKETVAFSFNIDEITRHKPHAEK